MKFGPLPIEAAVGAMLAHSAFIDGKRYGKAHRMTEEDIVTFRNAGIMEIVVAQLEPGDVDEDVAAGAVADALQIQGIDVKPPATGRSNFYAAEDGLFVVNRERVDALNRIDPSITLATLAPYAPVRKGVMVATVKIIPFAVAQSVVESACGKAASGEIMSVQPFRPFRIGIVQTMLPGMKPSIFDKTRRVTEARIAHSGSVISEELRTGHDEHEVAAAIKALEPAHDMVIIFGASAICDIDDVIPAAIRRAGGEVERFGMPVDPGNLLVMGSIEGKPMIGAPGCSRSPKLNGFDWVLDRMFAGLPITSEIIADMGVGGLLMEIPSRPQPRDTAPEQPVKNTSLWGVLLAAGHSRRMNGPNKLMSEFDGENLVRRSARRLKASSVAGMHVVLGHQSDSIGAQISDLSIETVFNPLSADGLAGSLKTGIAAVPEHAAGALVALADMPAVTSGDYDRMIAAFRQAEGRAIVRATHGGKRGNPVILPRTLFADIALLDGDTGARHIIESATLPVIDIELGAAASMDVDTPEALKAAGGVMPAEKVE